VPSTARVVGGRLTLSVGAASAVVVTL